MTTAAKPTRTIGRKLRNLALICLAAFAIIVIALFIAYFYITRSSFIVQRVLPVLEYELGGDVELGAARYEGDGVVVLRDFRLSSPEHTGEVATIVHVDEAVIRVNPRRLLKGVLELESVRLHGGLVRLAEDADQPGNFTFLSLKPAREPDSETPIRPPRVVISDARLEVGDFAGDVFDLREAIRVTGSLQPDDHGDMADGWYDVELREIDKAGELLPDGLRIEGDWNAHDLAHAVRLDSVNLNDRVKNLFPAIPRQWWENLGLEGRVKHLVAQWSATLGYRMKMEVADVQLTIPIRDLQDQWARYQDGRYEVVIAPPRMRVDEGIIWLSRQRLELQELHGAIVSNEAPNAVPVPYILDLALDTSAARWRNDPDWLTRGMRLAPFDIDIELLPIEVHPDDGLQPPAVEIPTPLARTLEKFNMTSWTLSSKATITRAPPEEDETGELIAGELVVQGNAWIREATGHYEKFAYPLRAMEGRLTYDHQRVEVVSFRAQGAEDAMVRIRGDVIWRGPEAHVGLTLTGEQVPIDADLRSALRGTSGRLFDALLDEAAYQSLIERGLVQPHDPEDPDSFAFGGTVNLDLHIDREWGRNKPTYLTGAIHINRVGIVAGAFPYPITAVGGTLRLQPERIVLSDESGAGIPIHTRAGGTGQLSGHIDIDPTQKPKRFDPFVEIEISGDPIGPMLYAAIPPSADEQQERPEFDAGNWQYTRAGRFIDAFHLDGALDWQGRFTNNADRKLQYAFDITMNGGTAAPGESLAAFFGVESLAWPSGQEFEQVSIDLHVTPDAVLLNDMSALMDQTRVEASGRIDLGIGPDESVFDVAFDRLALDEVLLNFIPDERRAQTESLWNRYQPRGAVDVLIHHQSVGAEDRHTDIAIVAADIAANIDGEPVSLQQTAGSVLLGEDGLRFDEAAIAVQTASERDINHGVITIDGSYDASLRGSWTGGRFQSPLVREALALSQSRELADRYEAFEPSGEFDAQFKLDAPVAAKEPEFTLALQPRTLSLTLSGTPVAMQIDDGAEVDVTQRAIEFRAFRGQHFGGAFGLDGRIDLTPDITADLSLSYDGRLGSEQFKAFLPAAVRQSFDALAFHDTSNSRLADSRLYVRRMNNATGDPDWHTDFDGVLHLTDGALDPGIAIRQFSGVLDIDAEHRPDRPLHLNIDLRAERLRAMGELLTSVTASIRTNEAGERLLVQDFRGDMYGGLTTLNAVVDIAEEPRRYTTTLDIAGASLEGMIDDIGIFDEAVPVTREPMSQVPSGEVFAGLHVSGVIGDPASRRGRGNARVVHGDIAGRPFLISLLHLTEFVPPMDNTLDRADFDFYIDESVVSFENILLESRSIDLRGWGDLDYASGDVDMRFRSRGKFLPGVSDVLSTMSDQLFIIQLSGQFPNPDAKLVPLPGLTDSQPTLRSAAATTEQSETGP